MAIDDVGNLLLVAPAKIGVGGKGIVIVAGGESANWKHLHRQECTRKEIHHLWAVGPRLNMNLHKIVQIFFFFF